jgi:phospholipase C
MTRFSISRFSIFVLFLFVLAPLECGSVAVTDLTTVTRPGPRQLIWLGDDLILDWDPPTGAHLIWRYDPSATGSHDPLPGNPVVTGTWSSIRTGHELIYLGQDIVLDWEPLTGSYRLWRYNRTLTGEIDPFPGLPVTSGVWSSIRTGHKLLYLGPVGNGVKPERVLDWEPGSGHYRLWVYDRSVMSGDPFPGQPVTEGVWSSVHEGHELVALEGDRVLDWEPQSGHYRVWSFDPNAAGTQDPLPVPSHNEGTWSTVRLGHVLVPLVGRQRVLDWNPLTGGNRVWGYDAAVIGSSDPLPGPAITEWTWNSVRSTTSPILTASKIKHLVLIVQENHSFDAYFGNYCTGTNNPSCTTGPSCCEAGQKSYSGISPPPRLDDAANTAATPDNSQGCMLLEIDGGKMDKYTLPSQSPTNPTWTCGTKANFAYAWEDTVLYRVYARSYALADRYFQPVAGASAANDIYFTSAHWRFNDNAGVDSPFTARCCFDTTAENDIQHVGALLWKHGVAFTTYADGMLSGAFLNGDNPFAYYQDPHARDPRHPDWTFVRDVEQFKYDLEAGTVPSVSFFKAQDTHSEHPGRSISDGMTFVGSVVNRIMASPLATSTLILVTFDESGGFFDHIAPPANPPASVDNQGLGITVPYGPRVPLLAVGYFAKRNHISHVQMEHSSIVKFIEWNWMNQITGQLGARDGYVNNIGSLLDPAKTGTSVPTH